MSHRTAEFAFAADAAFQQRLAGSLAMTAMAVSSEATDAAHPNRTPKRQALAYAALLDPGAWLPRFARAVVCYSGSAVGAAVDYAYDGHAPADGYHPSQAEAATICAAANAGLTDAQLDAAVSACWNALAGITAADG